MFWLTIISLLAVVFVNANTLENCTIKIIGVDYNEEDSVIVVNNKMLNNTMLKIIAPSGTLVFKTHTQTNEDIFSEVKITETGFYWMFFEYDNQKTFHRLYVK